MAFAAEGAIRMEAPVKGLLTYAQIGRRGASFSVTTESAVEFVEVPSSGSGTGDKPVC